MCFGVLEKGAVLHSGGWGARAQPPAAILPVLGKLRKLHPTSLLCASRGRRHCAHRAEGARKDDVP